MIIDETEGMPSTSAYIQRFGSLIRAYQTVGFTPDRDYRFLEVNRYVFLSAKDERLSTKASQHVELVLNFLTRNPCATRSDIVRKCFQGHLSKVEIDACLDHLLGMSPPKIKVQVMTRSDGLPGGPRRAYSLAS